VAETNGDIAGVKCFLLAQYVDPSCRNTYARVNNYAVKVAARSGLTEILEMLLRNRAADSPANDKAALVTAAKYGNNGVVRAQ
jgi:hypothetical protein